MLTSNSHLRMVFYTNFNLKYAVAFNGDYLKCVI